jgi:hypothetical protein
MGNVSLRVNDEKLRADSSWPSVEEIPRFPYPSFSRFKTALEAGECYLGVDQASAYQHAGLVQRPPDRFFGLFLTWVPLLACLASLIAAIASSEYWLLLGIPVALVGFVFPMAGKLVRRLVDTAARDPAIPFLLRMTARFIRALSNALLAMILWSALFIVLLFSKHDIGAWLAGTYIISANSIRWFRARGATAVRDAAGQSEAFFLYALSRGAIAVLDRNTDTWFFE